jgi:hypothetical protein
MADEREQAMEPAETYLPPFAEICRHLGLEPDDTSRKYLTIPTQFLRFLISELLKHVPVDEDFYRKRYPDVAEAVAKGKLPSCRDHFVYTGYYEGRVPAPEAVDEAWYLSAYPDVAEAVRKGRVGSASEHYLETGQFEGRSASAESLRQKMLWRDVLSHA